MELRPVHITMVKKRLASGQDCHKCVQVEELLRARGAWSRINEVVWADEREPHSEGMQLAKRYGIEAAPFFLVDEGNGARVAYGNVLELLRDGLRQARSPAAQTPAANDIEALALDLEGRKPADIVRSALERFGKDCAIAFSGAEDVALIDMAVRTGLPFSVICLDTGRLHAETYRFIERVRTHYGVDIELFSPDPARLEPFVRTKGLFSFLEDGHKECCDIRKVEPLRRALGRFRAWMTGQRRDQSPTRTHVPAVQLDPAFAGREGPLLKWNPLAAYSSEQTWAYLREHDVPHNPLHERGFLSIGCEPCTRAVYPGQHEREGRWWWEAATQKECGLHSVPAPPKA